MDGDTVGLIVIGDEILRGIIVDTNTSYLAKSLKSRGFLLNRVVLVPDDINEIAEVISNFSKLYSIVFTSGGVGPTHDDVTYKSVALGLGIEVELNESLVNYYTENLPGQNEIKRLAFVPKQSEIIHVHSHTNFAVIKVKNVYVLPGSPKYFQPAVDIISSSLKEKLPLSMEFIDLHLTELDIVQVLDEQAEFWKDRVKIGSYPQKDTTRITFEGNEFDVLKAKKRLLTLLSTNPSHDKFTLEEAQAVIEDGNINKHVKRALEILEECFNRYKSNEIFLSFNGGKDCTVVLHLASTLIKLNKLPFLRCLYIIGDSFPELDNFVDQAIRYYDIEVISKQEPVLSGVRELLKENTSLKISLMGMRRVDPGSKNLTIYSATDANWPELIRANPILDWNYQQVWTYLLKHDVPYCSLYDCGYTSIGPKSTTLPNPSLKDPRNTCSYLPAYMLDNDSNEREGRT